MKKGIRDEEIEDMVKFRKTIKILAIICWGFTLLTALLIYFTTVPNEKIDTGFVILPISGAFLSLIYVLIGDLITKVNDFGRDNEDNEY